MIARFQLFIAITCLPLCLYATTIGVLQYNVKGDTRPARNTGIWSYTKNLGKTYPLQTKQANLIANQIISPTDPVDFITLEQSTINTTSGATPLLNTLLPQYNIHQWGSVRNENHLTHNDYDEAQISYDQTKWKLVPNTVFGGYWNGAASSDVRPYLIAEFSNIASPSIKVIIVATHFPHCNTSTATCASQWLGMTNFKQQIHQIDPNPETIPIIISGDYNESAETTPLLTDLEHTLNIGTIQISPALKSCCSSDDYKYAIDRVSINKAAEHAHFSDANIINNPTIPYPIGLNNDDEEHKAIYTKVSF